ncbi:hypothetical protein ACO0R3_001886 [Hanseniaspora guilliermondii]
MNDNMRLSTFKPFDHITNIMGFKSQDSAETNSTDSNNEILNASFSSDESNDDFPMEEMNHLSYIDSQTSEFLSDDKVKILSNDHLVPVLYKPNMDMKQSFLTLNKNFKKSCKEPLDKYKQQLNFIDLDDSFSNRNNISKFAIDSVTIYKKPNKSPSPKKSPSSIPSHSNSSSIKTQQSSVGLIASDCKNIHSSGVAYKNKLETIRMYRDTLLKTKDTGLMFDFAIFLLKTGLEIYEDNNKVGNKIIKEGCYYLKKMAIKGDTKAQYLLGDVYSNDILKCKNLKQSRILFETAAKKEHPESAYRAAICYEKGIGVSRDSRKALTYFKFAASRHHTQSMHKLGIFFFKGQMGVPQTIVTQQNGIKWLSRAVANGDENSAEAAYELAKIYERGFLDIIIPDINYAVSLYVHASSLGHNKSNTKLGQIYEKNDNKTIKQNKMLSIHYYTIASNGDDPDSNAQLKLSFFNLLGVENIMEPDLSLAFFWAEKASNLENSDAEYTLGYFYEKGIGCEKNKEKANEWYKKSFQHGNIKALKKFKKEDCSFGINDSFTSFISDVASEKSFIFDLKKKRNRIIGFMKRKKHKFEENFEHLENHEDSLRSSSTSILSNITDVQPEFFSTALPYIDTVGIPQIIKNIEHQSDKTFLHSKRLRRIFKPL